VLTHSLHFTPPHSLNPHCQFAALKAGPRAKKATAKPPATSAGDLLPAGPSQATAHIAAVPETAAIGGEIPVTMPEKLTKGRFLIELEASEGGATDLAGDAGAVGRFSLSGDYSIWPDLCHSSLVTICPGDSPPRYPTLLTGLVFCHRT
jgi:hypothetical protein